MNRWGRRSKTCGNTSTSATWAPAGVVAPGGVLAQLTEATAFLFYIAACSKRRNFQHGNLQDTTDIKRQHHAWQHDAQMSCKGFTLSNSSCISESNCLFLKSPNWECLPSTTIILFKTTFSFIKPKCFKSITNFQVPKLTENFEKE